jgi:ankyrin repeat protein
LTHFTLKEYFNEHWKDSDLFPDGHSMIAAACLSYLQFDHPFPPAPELSWFYTREYHLKILNASSPLIKYSVNNLGRHLKMSNDRALAQRCITVLEQEGKFWLLELSLKDSQNTTLHWAAAFGCTLVAELLIEPISHLLFPLQVVLQNRKWSVLRAINQQIAGKLVMSSAINIDARTSGGSTPLTLAVQGGHEATVGLLLNVPGVNVNSSDHSGYTPLLHAARNGHEAIVRLLLNAPGVDINLKKRRGETPLSFATREGYTAIVRLLRDTPRTEV